MEKNTKYLFEELIISKWNFHQSRLHSEFYDLHMENPQNWSSTVHDGYALSYLVTASNCNNIYHFFLHLHHLAWKSSLSQSSFSSWKYFDVITLLSMWFR